MHLSDGVLSPAMIVGTSLAGAGVVAYSIKGTRTEEIPKIAMMTAVFLVASTIRVPVGPTSVHLLMTGLIGLVAGRRAAATILTALLLQLFLFQFGGLSSLGANVLVLSIPALSVGMLLRPRLSGASGRVALGVGLAAGLSAVAVGVLLLAALLLQTNRRFGMGPLSTVSVVAMAHVPTMIVEGCVTAFAVRFIVRVRPDFFNVNEHFNAEQAPPPTNDETN